MTVILEFTNEAQTTLALPVSPTDTTITIASGTQVYFPAITTGQGFLLTLVSSVSSLLANEIVLVTAVNSNVLTVVRAQEGTYAQAWALGDFATNLMTAGTAQSFAQIYGLAQGLYPIPFPAITGLGTMATQNANNVAITGGSITGINFSTIALTNSTINSTTIGASIPSTGAFTTLNASGNFVLQSFNGYVYANGTGSITASSTIPTTSLSGTITNAQLANSSLTFNGVTVSLGGSGTITANTTNALTIGTGLSGTSFNGSAPVTIAIDNTVVTLSGVQTLTNKSLSGNNNTFTNIPNSALTNSTISGVALGTNLNSLTIGTGLSGTSYNGTSGVTIAIANSGVSANTYGNSYQIPVFAVNARGQITSVINTTIDAVTLTTGTISTTPVNSTDIANKSYVDNSAQGLSSKPSCTCATTADLGTVVYNNGASGVGATLTGTATTLIIDGYTPTLTDRILVKNETNNTYNGIYTLTTVGGASPWVLTRALDFNSWAETVGAFTFIEFGTINGSTGWTSTSAKTGTIGTTPITFTQFSGAGTYLAGTGLTLTGNTFSISNTGITANSYGSASSAPTFTVNAQGQLTLAANAPISIAPNQINATIPNSGLTNSTISGVSLGGSLNSLTIGTGLVGSSYNGSAGVTITVDSTIVTLNGAQTLTNKSISGSANTFTNIPNNALTNSTISGVSLGSNLYTLTLGTGLSGTSYNGSGAITAAIANTTVTAGNYGSATQVGTFTVNAQGQLTLAGNTTVTPAVGSITGLGTGVAVALGNAVSGSGSIVLTNSPTLVTPALGTPSSIVLTNGTGLPLTTGVTGILGIANGGTNSTATPTAGGAVYGTGTAYAITSAGTTGQFLQSTGSGAPVWATASINGVTIAGNSTNATYYPLFTTLTTGTATTEYVSSSNYTFNPSTGVLSATGFIGTLNGSVGAVTPSSGVFTTLSAASINSTPIGATVPSTGAFTTLTATTLTEGTSPVVTQKDIGTLPNQVPLNQYLGRMAYQDPAGVNLTGGTALNLQNLGNTFVAQPTPSAVNASATLTIAQLLTRIITVNSATAVAFTLPTGTLTDAGILNGLLLVNQSFDWNIVNIGSAVGIITVSGGTNNTLIGSGTIAITTSATFRTVKTATNTYNTYRVN